MEGLGSRGGAKSQLRKPLYPEPLPRGSKSPNSRVSAIFDPKDLSWVPSPTLYARGSVHNLPGALRQASRFGGSGSTSPVCLYGRRHWPFLTLAQREDTYDFLTKPRCHITQHLCRWEARSLKTRRLTFTVLYMGETIAGVYMRHSLSWKAWPFSYNGFWTLKPYYLGTCTLRVN